MLQALIPVLLFVVALALCCLAFDVFPFRKARTALPVTTDQARFCRDCRNFLPQRIAPFGIRRGIGMARCQHPTAMRDVSDFLVRGYLHEDNMGYASIQRGRCDTALRFLPAESLDELEITEPTACGPQGRYWEKK